MLALSWAISAALEQTRNMSQISFLLALVPVQLSPFASRTNFSSQITSQTTASICLVFLAEHSLCNRSLAS